MSLAPTRPASGWSRSTALSASSQPAVTIVSLLRKTRVGLRASEAPRLQLRTKPTLVSLRKKRIPVTAASEIEAGSADASSTIKTSYEPGGEFAWMLLRQV